MVKPIAPLPLKQQAFFWGFVLVFLFLFLWVLNGVLFPFVLGIAIAYLLNPLVNFLAKIGFSRQVSTIMILSTFTVVFLGILALITPILYREISQFIDNVPAYVESLKALLKPWIERAQQAMGQNEEASTFEQLSKYAGTLMGTGKTVLSGLSSGGQVVGSILSVFFITPFVAFFMMKDWPQLLKWYQDLLPRQHKDTILDILSKIDQKISGFIRGQITVAVVLALVYAIAMSVVGLRYGFLIGLMAGLLNIVPMVGSIAGLVVGVSVAWLQTGDIMFVALVGGIFMAGQILEGNFLTPKFIGESVGLHPLWVFFSLMAGGALFGLTGMFLAVPVTASIGVLVGFALQQYKNSVYFHGLDQDVDIKPDEKPKTAKKTSVKSPEKTQAAKKKNKAAKPKSKA